MEFGWTDAPIHDARGKTSLAQSTNLLVGLAVSTFLLDCHFPAPQLTPTDARVYLAHKMKWYSGALTSSQPATFSHVWKRLMHYGERTHLASSPEVILSAVQTLLASCIFGSSRCFLHRVMMGASYARWLHM